MGRILPGANECRLGVMRGTRGVRDNILIAAKFCWNWLWNAVCSAFNAENYFKWDENYILWLSLNKSDAKVLKLYEMDMKLTI